MQRHTMVMRDEMIDDLRRLTDAVHAEGAHVAAQMGHAGLVANTLSNKTKTLAPSTRLSAPAMGLVKGATEAELDEVVAQFGHAATVVEAAGFDAIEIHLGHNYLLSSFLSPNLNKRTDRYGGSLENRMRYPLEVLDAVRAALPASVPVGLRVSATDWLEDDADVAHTTGSWNVEQCTAFSHRMRERGASFIHVSSGGISPRQKIPIGPGYQVHLAERMRRESGLPTIAVGLITEPAQAEAVVTEGRADFVAVARAMLFNPHWPWAAAAALGASVQVPPQYWRSQPRGFNRLFGDVHIGMR